MLIDYARAGMILSRDVTDERGNLLLENGAILTNIYLNRLKNLGISHLSVIDPVQEALRPRPAVPEKLRQELAICVGALYSMRWNHSQSTKLRYLYFQEINSTVKQIIAHLETNLPDISSLAVRQPTNDEIGHAVNVCLLSVITGLYLKMPDQILIDLAIGALLHDIGKTAIAASAIMRDRYIHTMYGHDLLLANNMNSTVARIAAEHHEKPNGSGYPMGMLGKDIHPLSRLVAVVNYFDYALSHEEETGRTRQEIIESMLAGGHIRFDLNMLRAFFQTAAVYPIGSFVRLNSGKLAYILKNKSRLPLRPCIQLAETGVEVDLAFQPNITITELITE